MANSVKEKIRKSSPKEGLIQMLTITEKQFAGIEYVSGYGQKAIIDSDNRLVVL